MGDYGWAMRGGNDLQAVAGKVLSAMFASGVLRPVGDVKAEALEAFAEGTEEHYPEDVFPKPTDERYQLLQGHLARMGTTLDRFSADLMRRAAQNARLAAAAYRTPASPNSGED